MISLKINKGYVFKVGEVLHLKVTSFYEMAPGKWRLAVDDVKPLPAAETMYFCTVCQDRIPAKEDGSLPEGWTERKFEKGSAVVCPDHEEAQVCRICGCTDSHACNDDEEPCYWVETNLCSACAKEKGTLSETTELICDHASPECLAPGCTHIKVHERLASCISGGCSQGNVEITVQCVPVDERHSAYLQ